MRLIDADALKFYGNHIGDEYEDRFHDKQWVHRDEIDDAPTIDAVEVVRCKDCRYRKKVSTSYYCELDEFNVKDADFCSWGERKGGDSE